MFATEMVQKKHLVVRLMKSSQIFNQVCKDFKEKPLQKYYTGQRAHYAVHASTI